jgi:hypothetical protein
MITNAGPEDLLRLPGQIRSSVPDSDEGQRALRLSSLGLAGWRIWLIVDKLQCHGSQRPNLLGREPVHQAVQLAVLRCRRHTGESTVWAASEARVAWLRSRLPTGLGLGCAGRRGKEDGSE